MAGGFLWHNILICNTDKRTFVVHLKYVQVIVDVIRIIESKKINNRICYKHKFFTR